VQKNSGGEQLKMKDKIILICMAGLVVAAIAVKFADASIQHTGFRIIDFAIIFLMIVSGKKPRNTPGEIRNPNFV
jgi:hypothetical protein